MADGGMAKKPALSQQNLPKLTAPVQD